MVVGNISTGTDVLIIGGGPGGYVAAIQAGQLDMDVTLVEGGSIGGTCLNHGCIPSKAMITATHRAHETSNSEHMGIHADLEVKLSELVDWKNNTVNQLTNGVSKLCQAAGVNIIEGWAEFTSESSVRIAHQGNGQGSETVDFENCIIASGSRPIEIPGFEFDEEQILSSREALALDDIPDSMVVIGGGYIGMELSPVFAKLGTDITVVEMLDRPVPAYEDDVARIIQDRAEKLGIDFQFGETAKDWGIESDGVSVRTENGDGEISEYRTEKCLVAVGREPVTDILNLWAIELETSETGFIDTDEEARTNLDNIYAVGDVAGEPMLAHKASKEGEVAAEVIAGEPATLDHQAIPAAVFTDPEIGSVGMTSAEAEEEGFELVVGQMPLRASGRALTMDDTAGFVRIVADEDTGFILGAQIVAPEASELIGEVGLAIEMGATLEDLSATIHTHSTLSEVVMEAVANAQNKAIHTTNT